ncbi:MAG: 2-amino-4-hydroxy-6-hydroxymethyldihydropteridine diphosphokinase [Bacillota bacterium]
MKKAYIALGSNLGNRLENLKRSLKLLSNEKGLYITAISDVYETKPIGGPGQGYFLNACAELRTILTPTILLQKMLDVENTMGRVRVERWGPRLIDLDLLVYNKSQINSPLLELPHPRLLLRDFVLIPLADIAPDLIIPGQENTVSEIISNRKTTDDVKPFLPSDWHSAL